MASRLTVQSIVPDPRAHEYQALLDEQFRKSGLTDVAVTTVYTISASLTKEQLARAGAELANATTEAFSDAEILCPEEFSHAIEIGFLPGVTDNVGKTARQVIADTLGRSFPADATVHSSLVIFLGGRLSRDAVKQMTAELHNPLIERADIYSPTTIKRNTVPLTVPTVTLGKAAPTDEVDLELSDAKLAKLGKEGIANANGSRRGPLALSLAELHAIRDYFRKHKRQPTDIELESLAQTWSEHCKHTIFNDPLDDISEGLFKRYIRGATETIRRTQGAKDICVSVFTDNSGAIAFDDDYMVTHKVETHNSPSALDPFGGAVTGVVGVNRDTLGFGLAAKPIANVYGFCVGRPTDTRPLFRDQRQRQPLLSPRRILSGVVRGINVGGNQSGIPTPLGFVYTDDSFRGKPLVFAGTIGLMPRRSRRRALHTKRARPGDYIVMIGGRVGLDGIHGATFSSEALATGSPATAVQIGDPITQKKFSDALIQEARDQGLYSSITDNGAGGLSCSVAEMARECGGCRVNLDKVPLKYPGLAPWQIWISESQERMTLAVPPSKWKRLQKLLATYGVEGTRIGTFTSTSTCVVKYGRKTIMNLDMAFLHDGRPPAQQQSQQPKKDTSKRMSITARRSGVQLERDLVNMLARPNIGSLNFISQQYDHEVQGTSVTKPLQGRGRVNVSAAVMRPLPTSRKGVVLSHALYPLYAEAAPYAMAAAAIDTAIRNAIASGGSLKSLALLDNFCWSSGDTPERLYQLKEAARACYDTAVAFGTPYISGKDSMFNDFKGYTKTGASVHIAALPTLLISALGVMDHVKHALTLDLKTAGNVLYLLGETHDELGGSEYALYLQSTQARRYDSETVPRVDSILNIRTYNAFTLANRKRLVASACSVAHGGLAVAISRMALAGQLGADIALTLPGTATTPTAQLFTESQGRIVAEVPKRAARQFEKLMTKKEVPFAHIGQVVARPKLTVRERRTTRPLINSQLLKLEHAYRSPFEGL